MSDGVPDGASSRNWWSTENAPVVGFHVTRSPPTFEPLSAVVPSAMLLVSPLPQSRSRVKVSSVPGSTIVPERVAKSSSSIDEVSAMPVTSGATLSTWTVVASVSVPPRVSLTLTLTGKLPLSRNGEDATPVVLETSKLLSLLKSNS